MRPITPELAGEVTRLLLEHASRNPLRELVDTLISKGLTEESFAQFCSLAETNSVVIPRPVTVEVRNFIRRLERGNELLCDARESLPASEIEKAVRRAVRAASGVQARQQPTPKTGPKK